MGLTPLGTNDHLPFSFQIKQKPRKFNEAFSFYSYNSDGHFYVFKDILSRGTLREKMTLSKVRPKNDQIRIKLTFLDSSRQADHFCL